jgi:TonB family protein
MYFEIDESRPETPTIESAISRREGVLLSIVGHLLAILAIVFVPELPFVQRAIARAEEARLRAIELAREREQAAVRRFVFVQPRADFEAAKAPPRPELSDRNRLAQTIERALKPTNPLPYARGNTSERVEAATPSPEPPHAAPEPAERGTGDGHPAAPREVAPPVEPAPHGLTYAPAPAGRPGSRLPVPGALAEALRNIERYVPESFNNPQGGATDFGSTIQFDTKGVEFGPWIRRFVAQVKRNWFIPYAAMSLRGHVVITFFVHKDGTITDLTVVKPSAVEAFTNAAYNALAASNPTQPLPPEYPADRAFFTVTFYYNETPP